MSITEYFKQTMRQKGIKQKYVADRTGYSEDTVSKYLCGRVRLTADAFLRFCDVLDVDPNVFRGEKNAH